MQPVAGGSPPDQDAVLLLDVRPQRWGVLYSNDVWATVSGMGEEETRAGGFWDQHEPAWQPPGEVSCVSPLSLRGRVQVCGRACGASVGI